MKVSIRGKNVAIPDSLKKAIAERVGLALGGLADRIALVMVCITSPPATAAGKPTACRVEITITRNIRVETTHVDPLVAVKVALESAQRKVSRMLRHEFDSGDLGAAPKRPARI
jgi:ribosome-associated translation inhibitor RaiA